MENTMTTMTSSTSISACQTSAFGMPLRGRQSLVGGVQWIETTGLSFDGTDVRDIRDRKDLAAKGHVAFVAYLPGIHAWSPPIC